MKKTKIVLCALFVTACVFNLKSQAAQPAIIPWPKEIKSGDDYWRIDGSSALCSAVRLTQEITGPLAQ